MLHIATLINKTTSTLILEPVMFDDCLIVLSEDEGPTVTHGMRRWPVRTYDLCYSIDRVMSLDRYRKSPQTLHLYPFERYVANGVMSRSSTDPIAVQRIRLGTPKELKLPVLRKLEEAALVLPTGFRGEMRLLKPLKQALVDISESET